MRFMTFLRAFFCGLVCVFCSSYVVMAMNMMSDNPDPRKEVEWSDYPQIVHVKAVVSEGLITTCTGQYVAPNIILTAAHCVKDDNGKLYNEIVAVTSDKKECYANKVFSTGKYIESGRSHSYDFAAFELTQPECYSSSYYNIKESNVNEYLDVYNVGFGSLTILSKEEIETLKAEFDTLKSDEKTNPEIVEEKLSDKLKRPIRDEFDKHKLKKGNCSGRRQSIDEVFFTDCYAWKGNSGGPIIGINNSNLIGVMSGSNNDQYKNIGIEEKFGSGGPSSAVFKEWLLKYIKEYPPVQKSSETPADVVVAGNNTDNTGTTTDTTVEHMPGLTYNETLPTLTPMDESAKDEAMKNLQAVIDAMPSNEGDTSQNPDGNVAVVTGGSIDIETAKNDVNKQAEKAQEKLEETVKKKKRTDADFVHGILENVVEINRLKELEEAYKKAKERETSFGNRMLSGLTMAATGLGGMQLAEGLAEKSADEAAERDMTAYLATFQCKVGDKRYSGGTTGIETPGANQLITLYQEYVDLAADLKERKNALGMRPGIEAEVKLDKANTGLYDNVGRGIENGTYASLYRASKGNEADKQKIAEQKDTSGKKVKAGAIAAGVGAVGGIIGNIAINGDDKNDEDDSSDVKDKYTINLKKSGVNNKDVTYSFDLTKDGKNNLGYNLTGRCAQGMDDNRTGNCANLTKRGTWWTSFSYGIVYGESRCGTKDEHPDKSLAGVTTPCFCKITSVDENDIKDAKWVYFTGLNGDDHCKNACATNCSAYLSTSERLRKESLGVILKRLDKKSNSGLDLKGIGADLGSNSGQVISAAAGFLGGSSGGGAGQAVLQVLGQ